MANKVWISGRLAADVDVKRVLKEITSEAQKKTSAIVDGKRVAVVANFTVVVNRHLTNGEDRDYIHCAAFGKTAFNIERYCGKKGMGIEILGSIRTQAKTMNGKKVHTQDVWVESWTYPPSNDKFEKEEELPKDMPEIAFVPAEENNLPEPPKEEAVDDVYRFEAEQSPYNYYEEEAEEGNFLPPGM